MFTAKELSRFTGGAPLNLTRIAEVQRPPRQRNPRQQTEQRTGCKVKKEPGGVEEESERRTTRRWMPRAHQMKAGRGKEKDDVFVDPRCQSI